MYMHVDEQTDESVLQHDKTHCEVLGSKTKVQAVVSFPRSAKIIGGTVGQRLGRLQNYGEINKRRTGSLGKLLVSKLKQGIAHDSIKLGRGRIICYGQRGMSYGIHDPDGRRFRG